jgi:methionine-rich copper-binding protein CopC
MKTSGWMIRWAMLSAGVMILPPVAEARAVRMTGSTPAAETIIHGDHAEYVVRFDGPVNHFTSRLEINQDGHVLRSLKPLADSAVDVLFAAGPVPAVGHYTLHWTAVSADGETSSGEVPFSVGQ